MHTPCCCWVRGKEWYLQEQPPTRFRASSMLTHVPLLIAWARRRRPRRRLADGHTKAIILFVGPYCHWPFFSNPSLSAFSESTCLRQIARRILRVVQQVARGCLEAVPRKRIYAIQFRRIRKRSVALGFRAKKNRRPRVCTKSVAWRCRIMFVLT